MDYHCEVCNISQRQKLDKQTTSELDSSSKYKI